MKISEENFTFEEFKKQFIQIVSVHSEVLLVECSGPFLKLSLIALQFVPQVRKLVIYNNYLTKIHEIDLFCMLLKRTHVKSLALYCSCNSLKFISELTGFLEEFELGYPDKRTSKLSPTFHSFKMDCSFDFTNSPLKDYKNLFVLKLNRVNTLGDPRTFLMKNLPPNLHTLSLRECRIEAWTELHFRNFSKLKSLDLSSNRLSNTNLAHLLRNLSPNVCECLKLESCHLKKLFEHRDRLFLFGKLKILILNDNALDQEDFMKFLQAPTLSTPLVICLEELGIERCGLTECSSQKPLVLLQNLKILHLEMNEFNRSFLENINKKKIERLLVSSRSYFNTLPFPLEDFPCLKEIPRFWRIPFSDAHLSRTLKFSAIGKCSDTFYSSSFHSNEVSGLISFLQKPAFEVFLLMASFQSIPRFSNLGFFGLLPKEILRQIAQTISSFEWSDFNRCVLPLPQLKHKYY